MTLRPINSGEAEVICDTCGKPTGATFTGPFVQMQFWRTYCSATCRDSQRVDAHRQRLIDGGSDGQ